jgi:DNA-binding response OmpR family regulator
MDHPCLHNHSVDELAKAIARELLRELRARAIETIATQSQGSSAIDVGPLKVDPTRHEVMWQGQLIDLKPREFALLSLLVQNAGRAFTRQQLLDLAWPEDMACGVGSDRTVDVHVARIRAKLGQEAARLIRTISGVGYKLQVPAVAQ